MKAPSSKFYWSAGILLFVLVGYNTWSYLTGRCTLSMLLSPSPAALILLAAILITALALIGVKIHNHAKTVPHQCQCGQPLVENQWHYCPTCGRKIH